MADVPANLVLTLIRTVGEAGATEREKYAIGEIAKHFEKTGASQLASYARSQIGEEPVWVPMEAEPIVDDGKPSSNQEEACKWQDMGNRKSERAALEEIIDALNEARTEGEMEHWEYSNLFDIADAGMAAKPRNCDVGTAVDQTERWKNYCCKHYHADWVDEECNGCPCCGEKGDCEFIWGQMLYED